MIEQRIHNFKTIVFCIIFLLTACQVWGWLGEASAQTRQQSPKNIILMIGDGMGQGTVTATRLFKYGSGGGYLSFEKFPVIGYQATHSADSTVTDSAAASSAWACGEKFRNGEISCHDNDGDGRCDGIPETILELAKRKGKSVGLVVTSTITHATPAAFAAHVADRGCEMEIARQYIEKSGVDLFFGGGFGPDVESCQTPSMVDKEALIEKAHTQYNYLLVKNRDDVKAAVGVTAERILGLFSESAKTPEYHHLDPAVDYPPEEPTLEEMAIKALEFLNKDPDGFFMVLEGSQIDWAHHRHDMRYMLAETLAFDNAVQATLKWLQKRHKIGEKTLILVMSDHETGGFAVVEPDKKPAAKKVPEGKWSAGYHTAVDTLIWSTGPGSIRFGKALDNTEVHSILSSFLDTGN